MEVDVIILAAGQGTRMRSKLPKVLHPLAGSPMLSHVISTARQLNNSRLNIVIGHGADQVRSLDNADDISFSLQAEQKGTGHAAAQALPALRDDSISLILFGDVPLIRSATLQRLIDIAATGKMGLLTAVFDDPSGYGRIIRDDRGNVVSNIEHKDATQAQRGIQEVNTGFMALPTAQLREWLPRLSSDNAQGEYYLTDLIAMAANDGNGVETAAPESLNEVQGVNSRRQLIELEREYQQQCAEQFLDNGLAIMDPKRFDLRGSLQVGQDCVVDVNCVFEGEVTLGDDVRVGPNCLIRDAVIGDGVEILANSVIESAVIDQKATVGPFARLRPGSHLCAGSKVGNFVEMKNAELGIGSKVNHLSYVGDAEIGSNSNIGAGTITCNYDGAHKHKTSLGDEVFVGSNSTLVAPLDVAAGGFIAAGSTITSKVGNEQLAIGRGKQRNIDGWKRPTKDS